MKGSRVKQTEKKGFFFSFISGHFRLIKINLQKRHKKYYNKLFIVQKKYKLTRYSTSTQKRKMLVKKNFYETERKHDQYLLIFSFFFFFFFLLLSHFLFIFFSEIYFIIVRINVIIATKCAAVMPRCS